MSILAPGITGDDNRFLNPLLKYAYNLQGMFLKSIFLNGFWSSNFVFPTKIFWGNAEGPLFNPYSRGGQPTPRGPHAPHKQFLCGPPGTLREEKTILDLLCAPLLELWVRLMTKITTFLPPAVV